MISPHTPPGTKVAIAFPLQGNATGRAAPYKEGDIFCLIEILPSKSAASGFVAVLSGADLPFCLSVLRRLDLPECLTSLLNTAPVDSDLVATSHVPVPSLVRPPAHQLAGDAEHIADPASPASFLRLKRLLHGLRRS